jgi:antitoxin (DNA-binding transcriptional repressor) of toxin-antitoxin stability system
MVSAGIRHLKSHLSQYIRRVESGERIAITAHGRVVAELGPPGAAATARRSTRLDELIAAGVVRPATDTGPLPDDWPDIRLPAGTAAILIDEDRGET